jgi:hypothetical protein
LSHQTGPPLNPGPAVSNLETSVQPATDPIKDQSQITHVPIIINIKHTMLNPIDEKTRMVPNTIRQDLLSPMSRPRDKKTRYQTNVPRLNTLKRATRCRRPRPNHERSHHHISQ